MITLDEFKSFLGYFRKGTPASPSQGILTLTRKSGITGDIFVFGNVVFRASGKSFIPSINLQTKNSIATIADGVNFITLDVKAENPGTASNLPANQTWIANIDVDYNITNDDSFSGGVDEVEDKPGIYQWNGTAQENLVADDRLQACLNTGQAVVMELMGVDDEDFDHQLLKEAVFLIAMYRMENNTSQDISYQGSPPGVQAPNTTKRFKDHVYEPLLLQVEHLISQSGKRNIDLLLN